MKPRGQKGFTLIQAMIVMVIVGILSTVIAKLFKGGMQGWMFSNANLNNQQRVRVARDQIVKSLRQGQASSIVISSFNSSQPPRSMITYITSTGSNKVAYYQLNDKLYLGSWTWTDPTKPMLSGRTISAVRMPIIQANLWQAQFFYPNMKDDRNLSFTLYSVWRLPKAVANNSEVYLVGNVELRNP